MNNYNPNFFNRKTVESMKFALANVLSENTRKKSQTVQPNPKDPSTFAPPQGNPFEPSLGFDESGDFFRKGYASATRKDPKTGRPAQEMSTSETESSYADRTYTGHKRKLENELRNYGSKSEKGRQAAAALGRLETSYNAYKNRKKEQIQTLQGGPSQQGMNLSGTNTYSDPNISITNTSSIRSPFARETTTPSFFSAGKDNVNQDSINLPKSFSPSTQNFPLRSPESQRPNINSQIPSTQNFMKDIQGELVSQSMPVKGVQIDNDAMKKYLEYADANTRSDVSRAILSDEELELYKKWGGFKPRK